MYKTFFGLTREPFSVAPDPHFMYMSPKHREALGHLMYGLARGAGFVLLTGEIGAGKTTVWRSFLERLPANFDVAYVVNPKLQVNALLARVCEDLRIELSSGAVDLIDAIHGHLLLAYASGRRTLIVVDEAQALSHEVLELLRLLTNLDSKGGKLQVLLIGQPELRTMLHHPSLEPLAQRVVARFHLTALPEEETARYVAHRLAVAGYVGHVPFDPEALSRVHRLCGGVPRRINVLCDRALLTAKLASQQRIDASIVERAAEDVFGRPPAPDPAPPPAEPSRQWPGWAVTAAVAAVALAAGVYLAPRLMTRGFSLPARLSARAATPAPVLRSSDPAAPEAVLAAAGVPTSITVPAALAATAPQPSAVALSGTVAMTGAAAPTGTIASPGAAAPTATLTSPGAAAVTGAAAAANPLASNGTAASPGNLALNSTLASDSTLASNNAAASPGIGPPGGTSNPANSAQAMVLQRTAQPPLKPVAQAALSSPDAVFDAAAVTEALAWRDLSLLWGTTLAPGEPCSVAEQQGLRCYYAKGGLGPVRQLGRPGIMRLTDGHGRVAFALLVGLTDDTATFRGRGTEQTVPLTALGRSWRGDFATFWRAPARYHDAEPVKDSGPLSSWLGQRLAIIDGSSSPPVGADALAARIFAFQLAQGLNPDGVAGPLTLMHLNRASGIDEPRLR
jgi:general secretion pathway protein A